MEAQFTDDEIAPLSSPERIALIAQLWDSLDNGELPLTVAQRAELDSRLSTLNGDREDCVTWMELKAELDEPAKWRVDMLRILPAPILRNLLPSDQTTCNELGPDRFSVSYADLPDAV